MSCLEPGLGIPVSQTLLQTVFGKGVGPLRTRVAVSAATLRPDSARQRSHQLALCIALSSKWLRAVNRFGPRLRPMLKAGFFPDGQSTVEAQPPKALLSNASLHPDRALPRPQTGFPKPSPQVRCSRLSVPQRPAHFRPGPPGSLRVPRPGSTLQVWPGRNPKVRGLPGPPAPALRAPAAPHLESRAGSHIRRRCRSGNAAKSGPRRRPQPRPAPATRGASPRAGSRESQPPCGCGGSRVWANRPSLGPQFPACLSRRQPPSVAYNSRLPTERPEPSSSSRTGR